MKAHLKRLNAPKTWRLLRQEKTWVARPYPSGMGLKYSLPIVFVLRNLLKVVRTAKEAKFALNNGLITVNGKIVRKLKHPVCLFDVIALPNAQYRLIFLKDHLNIIEINVNESKLKISKLVNKTILPKKYVKNIQLNLYDGFNLLTDNANIKIGSGIVYNFETKQIVSVIPFEENIIAYVEKGNSEGRLVKVLKIEEKSVLVELDGNHINLNKDYLLPLGKNKPEITVVQNQDKLRDD